MTTDGEAAYYFIPLDDVTVLRVPVEQEGQGADTDFAAVIEAVGPLIAAVLKRGGVSQAGLFELSPESQKMLATERKTEIGSYFRGVLRADDGKVSHQVQLREVSSAPAPSGLDAVLAAQLAGIQAQLGRMETILNEVALSTEQVVTFLERQQRAKLLTALRMVADVYDRARRTAELSDVDWQRLTGIELELDAQLRAVGEELEDRLQAGSFNGDPRHDVKSMKKISPARVCELVELHRVLIGGLRRWQELVLLRKVNLGVFDEHELQAFGDCLRELHEKHQGLLARLETIADASNKARPRSNWKRLLTDGILVGSRNDDHHLEGIRAGRRLLLQSSESSRTPKSLPSADQGSTHLNGRS